MMNTAVTVTVLQGLLQAAPGLCTHLVSDVCGVVYQLHQPRLLHCGVPGGEVL